ncbi:hypothetical protein EII34_15035 [Arachnia propionica]|uniref:Uncharacterized protein n=1 Tax=Arachnia propionica TaxID=1750 RepID=A0A3P1T1H4_9ACTN|nr:hypothetical protein [Arachnia propionica]MDO5068412.1 hypothetical protein [Propionibacteriaceae bacterium]RRD03219.1 hypothetical protein EII34_15035 [Arachnia propionica]
MSSVEEASRQGRRAMLEALRDDIARRFDRGVSDRDAAALSRRLLAISEELDGVVATEGVDEIAEAAATPDAPWPAP